MKGIGWSGITCTKSELYVLSTPFYFGVSFLRYCTLLCYNPMKILGIEAAATGGCGGGRWAALAEWRRALADKYSCPVAVWYQR